MLELINFLCKNYSNCNQESKSDQSIFELVVRFCTANSNRSQFASLMRSSKEVLDDLLKFRQAKTGDSILLHAARVGNADLIRELHRLKPFDLNFNVANNDGKNALHEACQNSRLDCVKYLIECGKIDVNGLRKGDWTALMLACTRNNIEIVRYLCEYGADLKQTNKDGWTAFQIAVREGHLDIIEYFLSIDSSLTHAFKSKNGRSTLHTACLHGHLHIVRLFARQLDRQTMTDLLMCTDSCGNTPFSECLLADHAHLAGYLLANYRSHIDLNHRDKLENSFMHLIGQSGSLNALKLLFDKYYQLKENKQLVSTQIATDLNRFGMTVLHCACKNNRPSIVAFLLEQIAKNANENSAFNVERLIAPLLHQKDEHDRTPIEIAKSGRFLQILDLFSRFL